MATAATILDRAERTLGFERASVGVPGLESTNLLTVLNSAVKEYFSSFEKSGEPNSILRREIGYALVSDTNLNGALASGATSIVGDSFASFGTSGAVAIIDNENADYAEFTANNLTTTLSGVTGVSFAHEDDDTVQLLYALPAAFDGFRSEEGSRDGVTVDGTAYEFTSGLPVGRQFSIYDNGTTKYLHFPTGLTGDVFVKYNVAPTVITAESSTVDIPTKDEDFGMWAVVKYCALKLDRVDMFQLSTSEMLKILNSAHVRRNIGKGFRLRSLRSNAPLTRSQIFD